jgi:cell division inhibitor SepF
MAGAMRKMGVYLGLVEDDDARGGYDRYAARQSGYDHDDRGYDHDDRGYDRGYDRYAAAEYDDGTAGPEAGGRYGYGTGYPADGYDTGYPAEDTSGDHAPERVPEPEVSLGRRPAAPRTLGLAGSPAGSTSARLGGSGPSAAGGASIGAGGGRSRLSGGMSGSAGLAMSEPAEAAPAPAPEPAPEPKPKPAGYRITTVHPKSYNEARVIGERFRDGMPVIMNLTEMEHADAKRLVDFALGLTFGLHGSIERVTAKVFLLSPQDVDVTAEDKARIREGGFFSQS